MIIVAFKKQKLTKLTHELYIKTTTFIPHLNLKLCVFFLLKTVASHSLSQNWPDAFYTFLQTQSSHV